MANLIAVSSGGYYLSFVATLRTHSKYASSLLPSFLEKKQSLKMSSDEI
jgi:hypothetical protein